MEIVSCFKKQWKFTIYWNNNKNNIFSKKKRGMLSFESISSPYYKVYDFEGIKKINDSNDLRKKDIITNLWYGACLEFPLYDYDL